MDYVPSICDPVEVKFPSELVVTSANRFEQPGDSGALVLTEGSCPQPVGMLVGGTQSGTVAYVSPIAGVLQNLQTAAGSSASYVIVPGGGGCTATGQIEVEESDLSTATVDGTTPDPDILAALNARNDFMGGGLLPALMLEGVVDGVAIDFSTNPASLDVTANDGTFQGINDITFARDSLPGSFEGVPVEFTVTDVIDLTGGGGAYPN